MKRALEFATTRLKMNPTMALVAGANPLDKFTLHFSGQVFNDVLSGLDKAFGPDWPQNKPVANWYIHFSKECHTNKYFCPEKSPTIKTICTKVYNEVQSFNDRATSEYQKDSTNSGLLQPQDL